MQCHGRPTYIILHRVANTEQHKVINCSQSNTLGHGYALRQTLPLELQYTHTEGQPLLYGHQYTNIEDQPYH